MSHKLPDSVVSAIGTSQAYKSSTETSSSTVESTPSSTTAIDIGSEDEDDCHSIFGLKVIFMNVPDGPKVGLHLSVTHYVFT